MTLQLSNEEYSYIIDNRETDIVLTRLGMRLVDSLPVKGKGVSISVTEDEYEEFIEEIKDEYVWKSTRIVNPKILVGLAKRLLPEFSHIQPKKWS